MDNNPNHSPLLLPEGRGEGFSQRRPPKTHPKTKSAKEIDEEVRKRRKRASARAAVNRSRERGLAQMLVDPDDPKHGTATGYIYGCRCDRCRDNWNSRRHAQETKKKRKRGRPRNKQTRKRGCK